ncbi:FxLD family lantipeptide [Streptomyces kunmingensis]|uniref:FxLD family lantipeptide n=1 Tax=Streptomyces kunmingensis TaxID=68225 RepID=A0ABU6CR11_9ACTN|nr:FxLD family lantipeptide [Streptomyces kunmingensis]MEB3966365.1 FxLD family lantipeptide [Streptomyces kunmingensis]
MSIPTVEQQPAVSLAPPVPADDEWELQTTITRTPTPIVEACGTGDGCAPTCASSCISS